MMSAVNVFSADSSTTAGIYHPEIKQQIQNNQQAKVIPFVPANPICVDSGVQGRRCGITAINFCKNNPTALNCQTVLEDKFLKSKK
jgi:hypothetical protein